LAAYIAIISTKCPAHNDFLPAQRNNPLLDSIKNVSGSKAPFREESEKGGFEMSMVRKSYTEEFKREAVSLLEKSENKSQVARDLGVHMSLLKKWQKKLKQNGEKAFPGKGKLPDDELSQLKRENARLKEEVEILKKTVGIFSSRPR
jgi:transposase